MRFIPTPKQLGEKIKMVEVEVEGEFIARIDDKRKTSKGYKVKVFVPEKFNKSDIKRATPKALDAAYKGEFVSMRTFDQVGNAKKSDKTVARSTLYSKRELERFARLREEIAAREKKKKKAGDGEAEDSTEYGEDGLPPVIND